jgi:hypothetical protein
MTETTDRRRFYFQEEIRITDPFNTIKYMREVVEYQHQPDFDDPQAHPEGKPIRPHGIVLVGTWYLLGTTGIWPRAINLWECDGGWTGVWGGLLGMYAGMPEALFWKMSNEHRSGGNTVVYGARPNCPTVAELQSRQVTGELFLQERLHVRPGSTGEFLDAAASEYAPALADHGLETVGLYESIFSEDEVLMVFAGTRESIIEVGDAEESARGFGPAANADDRIVAWRSRAHDYVTSGRRELLSPCPGSPLSAF